MRILLVLLALQSASAAVAQSVPHQPCNVEVDVTDADPQGTNVRSAPGGDIVARLKNPTSDGWIVVHLKAQRGDWYEIDRARLIDVERDKETTIFAGSGVVHRSVVGLGGLQNGAVIYKNPKVDSAKLDPHAAGDQTVALLGCSGEFARVRVRRGEGWTKQLCTNMVTTCS